MPRRSRGTQALRSTAATIDYEFHTLVSGVAALSRAPTPEERNLVLEASLIHARNLRNFFASEGPNDDILAKDFVHRMRRVAMPYLRSKKSRRRLKRLLAHASCSRPRLSRDWDLARILREVVDAMRTFMAHWEEVHPRRARWFGEIPRVIAK